MVAERKTRREAYGDEWLARRPAACGHPGMCGCSVASCCMTCPLPVCRYEGGPSVLQLRSMERREAIVAAIKRGVKVDDIAEALGMSRRQVFRLAEGVSRAS